MLDKTISCVHRALATSSLAVSLKPESTRHVEFVPKCLYEERSRVGRHWWASNPDSLAPLDRGKHGLDGEPTMHSRRLMMQEQTRHLGRIEGIKPQTSGRSSRRKSHEGLVPPSSTVTSNFSSPKRLCGMAKRPDTKTASCRPNSNDFLLDRTNDTTTLLGCHFPWHISRAIQQVLAV